LNHRVYAPDQPLLRHGKACMLLERMERCRLPALLVSWTERRYPVEQRGRHQNQTRTIIMPNDQKPLKERIAALKAKRNEISREAKVRVASAYTVAKTLAPKAPAEIQSVIASALLTIPDTKVLVAAVKQSAVNNYYTKIAEELRDIHKVEMNDLLEKPEVLSKMKSEVESELKGGPKSAAAKTADDRTECGKQPESYTDPSIGITPKEM